MLMVKRQGAKVAKPNDDQSLLLVPLLAISLFANAHPVVRASTSRRCLLLPTVLPIFPPVESFRCTSVGVSSMFLAPRQGTGRTGRAEPMCSQPIDGRERGHERSGSRWSLRLRVRDEENTKLTWPRRDLNAEAMRGVGVPLMRSVATTPRHWNDAVIRYGGPPI